MANLDETHKSGNNANETSHYALMTVGIFIGFFGVIFRFLTNWTFVDISSNIILVIGVIISLKAVFNILK